MRNGQRVQGPLTGLAARPGKPTGQDRFVGLLAAASVPLELAPNRSGKGSAVGPAKAREAVVRRWLLLAGSSISRPHLEAAARAKRSPGEEEKPPGQHLDGRAERSALRSDFGLFGDFQGVVHLDTEVPHSRLQLGVARVTTARPEVLRAPVDQSGLGAPHRVRAVLGGI